MTPTLDPGTGTPDDPPMSERRYTTLRWIARNLPWVWRHVISAPTRIAWVDAAADHQVSQAAVDRLDRIMADPYTTGLADSTEEPRE